MAMLYPDDAQVIMDDKFETGLKFEGEEGWIFCTRGDAKVTASDANLPSDGNSPLRASDPKLISPLGADAERLPKSANHYKNWLESIVADKDPIAPVDQAARSLQACAAAWIGMKLGRALTWDVAKEEFSGDDEANELRDRKHRKPEYDLLALLKSAGI